MKLAKGDAPLLRKHRDLSKSLLETDASLYPVGKIIPGIVIDRVAATRVLLALSALTVISVESFLSNYPSGKLKLALAVYALYSILVGIVLLRQNRLSEIVQTFSPWVDILCFAVLFVLGIESSSIFYFGFFFAIVGASFRRGFATGMGITITSCLLLIVVGYLVIPFGHDLAWSRFLLRPAFLLLIGYMVAHWGGSELKLKQRLMLLKEISKLSNPRFGVDRTVGYVMEQLRAFSGADACLIVTIDQSATNYILRRTYAKNPEKSGYQENISKEVAAPLLALPQESAVVFMTRSFPFGLHQRSKCIEYDLFEKRRKIFECEALSTVSASLDAASFISVPVRQNYQIVGRVYLTSNSRLRTFSDSDLEFFYQVIEHVMPVLENIRLVDSMATDAAERERQRIAFDIHDTVVQPYIGLQMGLTAVRQKIQNGGHNVASDIERLHELTAHGISQLRDYISGLKTNGQKSSSLETAVRRIAAKFSEGTGINVEINFEMESPLTVNDRLTAEVFQMVAEGLSNIRRHTQSANARISIGRQNGYLLLQIENDGGLESSAPFLPVSITERTTSLGGKINVNQVATDRTSVNIQIPL